MTTSAAVEARAARHDRWDRLRLLLAPVWPGLFVTAFAVHEPRSDLATLYADVGAGRVERVELVGGLGAYGPLTGVERDGHAHLDVRWSAGDDRRTAALVEVAGTGTTIGTGGRELTSDDVTARLRSLDPGLEVDGQPFAGGWNGSLLGVRLPGPAAAVLLVASMLTFGVLVGGPEPWRATRWAWFWVLLVPGGALALCLLAGPVLGVPAPRSHRRLTAGRAFLLATLIGGGAYGSTPS